jgi:acetate kinase
MKILALNSGSSSLKFAVVELEAVAIRASSAVMIARGSVEDIGGEATLGIEVRGETERRGQDAADTGQAVRAVLGTLKKRTRRGGEAPLEGLEAVGHRVVHGGPRFAGPVRIDAEVIAEIEALDALAPLHNVAGLAGVRVVRETLGEDIPEVAVFDTAFHHALPERSATYAIPRELAERHGIRRFGFHGISHAFLAARYAELTGQEENGPALVTLHLGSGCSAAAIRGGRPVDTSMGFTPLEGLVMGTRSGDLDPAIVGYLARREGVEVERVEEWLNHRSGLLGVTGDERDMRRVLERARAGDRRAELALELFCYRARKYVGAYLAALGGAEALVFAGAIGERSPEVRGRICEGMEWCGLRLDPARNAAAVGVEARIGADGAALEVFVIPTREELWIARETARLLAGA